MTTHSVEIQSSEGVVLQGMLDVPDVAELRGAVVVCHPHPLYGGDMHNNVVTTIASVLLQREIAVLRFNFRGVGQSTGTHGNGVGEVEDVLAALNFLSENDLVVVPAIGLAGYSFGGGVAFNSALQRPDLAALGLVSPAAGELGEVDAAALTMPKLILTGEADMFATVERVQAMAEMLPPPTETHVAPQTDHFWFGAEEDMGRRVGEFFAKAFVG